MTIAGDGSTREGHITDLVAPRFTALYFSEDGTVADELQELERAMQARGVPFKVLPIPRRPGAAGSALHGWDHTGRLFPMYGAEAGTLYLVRPDGHVLARWRHIACAEAAAAVNKVLKP